MQGLPSVPPPLESANQSEIQRANNSHSVSVDLTAGVRLRIGVVPGVALDAIRIETTKFAPACVKKGQDIPESLSHAW